VASQRSAALAAQAAQDELYAALQQADRLQEAVAEALAASARQQEEASQAEGFYAMRRANKELFEREHEAAMASARYEKQKASALALQEVFDARDGERAEAQAKLEAARAAHEAARQVRASASAAHTPEPGRHQSYEDGRQSR
jgi:hypothetical protein